MMKLRQQGIAIFWSASCLLMALAAGIGCGIATDDPPPDPTTMAGASATGAEHGPPPSNPGAHASDGVQPATPLIYVPAQARDLDAPHDDLPDTCVHFEDTIVIREAADLERFAALDCFSVHGGVTIQNTTDVRTLDQLAGLRAVSQYGVVISDNTALEDVRLPNLRIAPGMVLEDNPLLRSIELDAMEYAINLHVFNHPQLERASFSRFGEASSVIFAGNAQLEVLRLPCLMYVDDTFIFEHSNGLRVLALPNLLRVGGRFLVHYNGALEALLAPRLERIGDLPVAELDIVRNPRLSLVDLSSLTYIFGSEAGRAIVTITYNFQWSQCQIDELYARLIIYPPRLVVDPHPDVTIHDNNPVCRPPQVSLPDWCGCDTGACGFAQVVTTRDLHAPALPEHPAVDTPVRLVGAPVSARGATPPRPNDSAAQRLVRRSND